MAHGPEPGDPGAEGLQIFNAHPALYWGERSDRDRPLLALRARETPSGELRGATEVLGHGIDTTGVLGASTVAGERQARGFPRWATLPSGRWLAMGRRWHLFFAWVFALNGLLFGLYAVMSRHLTRDLVPSRGDLARLGTSLRDHMRLHFGHGPDGGGYNVLQKMSGAAGRARCALRLRVERQLGYKMAKYVMALEVVDGFARIGGGRGGYWEDEGYEWYAGI